MPVPNTRASNLSRCLRAHTIKAKVTNPTKRVRLAITMITLSAVVRALPPVR